MAKRLEKEVTPKREENSLMVLPKGVEVTAVGLRIKAKLSYEEWAELVQTHQRLHRVILWRLGDLLVYGEDAFGEEFSQVISEYAKQTQYNAMWVSRQVDFSQRREILSWSHHYEVAMLEPEQQDRFLQEAIERRWTTRELKGAVRLFRNPPPKLDWHDSGDGLDTVPDPQPEFEEVQAVQHSYHYPETTEQVRPDFTPPPRPMNIEVQFNRLYGITQALLNAEKQGNHSEVNRQKTALSFFLAERGGGQGESKKQIEYRRPGEADDKERARYSVEQWKELSTKEKAEAIERGFDSGLASMNKQESDSIGWARQAVNTVTGCLTDCPFCYARDIADRFFSYGFAPTFHPDRLACPQNVKVPEQAKTDTAFKNIFANSMSDLFGKWVPVEWIEATIEMARRNPQWNFLTLTKFPLRAAEFEFPDNWWMGTTVDAQARVENAERAFSKIKCKTKWLSCEPLLTPLKFKRLDLFQWVVMGGSSRSTKTPEWKPPMDWIVDLHGQARSAGLKIYHKTNLGVEDESRTMEFPWSEPEEKALPEPLRYLKGM